MRCDLESHPSRSAFSTHMCIAKSICIPGMGIPACLFAVGYCFSASGCDIVFMVVEKGAALAGRVFRLGGISLSLSGAPENLRPSARSGRAFSRSGHARHGAFVVCVSAEVNIPALSHRTREGWGNQRVGVLRLRSGLTMLVGCWAYAGWGYVIWAGAFGLMHFGSCCCDHAGWAWVIVFRSRR